MLQTWLEVPFSNCLLIKAVDLAVNVLIWQLKLLCRPFWHVLQTDLYQACLQLPEWHYDCLRNSSDSSTSSGRIYLCWLLSHKDICVLISRINIMSICAWFSFRKCFGPYGVDHQMVDLPFTVGYGVLLGLFGISALSRMLMIKWNRIVP